MNETYYYQVCIYCGNRGTHGAPVVDEHGNLREEFVHGPSVRHDRGDG